MGWTEMERSTLRRYYFIEGKGVRYRLPNKSRKSIDEEVKILGLDDEKEKQRLKWSQKEGRIDGWTDSEKEILKEFYPEEGAKTSLRFKNRTPDAVCKMASKMGIRRNKSMA